MRTQAWSPSHHKHFKSGSHDDDDGNDNGDDDDGNDDGGDEVGSDDCGDEVDGDDGGDDEGADDYGGDDGDDVFGNDSGDDGDDGNEEEQKEKVLMILPRKLCLEGGILVRNHIFTTPFSLFLHSIIKILILFIAKCQWAIQKAYLFIITSHNSIFQTICLSRSLSPHSNDSSCNKS